MKSNYRDYDEDQNKVKTIYDNSQDNDAGVKKTTKITIDLNKITEFIKNILLCVLIWKLIGISNIIISSQS